MAQPCAAKKHATPSDRTRFKMGRTSATCFPLHGWLLYRTFSSSPGLMLHECVVNIYPLDPDGSDQICPCYRAVSSTSRFSIIPTFLYLSTARWMKYGTMKHGETGRTVRLKDTHLAGSSIHGAGTRALTALWTRRPKAAPSLKLHRSAWLTTCPPRSTRSADVSGLAVKSLSALCKWSRTASLSLVSAIRGKIPLGLKSVTCGKLPWVLWGPHLTRSGVITIAGHCF